MTRLPPISSFLTPPSSKLLDDFYPSGDNPVAASPAKHNYTMSATKSLGQLVRPAQILSPPISPEVALQLSLGVDHTDAAQPASAVPDPLLFSESASKDESSIAALFPSEAGDQLRKGIRQHIARRDAPSKSGDLRHKRRLVMPTEDEYLRFVTGVSRFSSIYNRNPMAYRSAILAQNADHYRSAKGLKPIRGISNAAHRTFQKPVLAAKPPKMPRVSSGGKVQKPLAQKRSRRPTISGTSAPLKGSITDDKVATKKKTEDVDFESLPDLAPPTSTLDDGRRLRTDWTATPLDLTHDPHRHLLHSAEVTLASALRLSCATYLCSKRRIFVARVNSMNKGKEFRKTDAQQACKIDVNKASRLWMAYDSVGWLDQSYFGQHQGMAFD